MGDNPDGKEKRDARPHHTGRKMVTMMRQHNYEQFAGRGEEWPFAVGDVRGVRMWRVCRSGHIHPAHVEAKPWTSGLNTAACLSPRIFGARTSHTAPHVECSCGFYAYFDHGRPARSLARAYSDAGYGVVAGTIRGYGRTLIGTEGFRCEKAQIESLYIEKGSASDDFLKKEYGDIERVGLLETPIPAPDYDQAILSAVFALDCPVDED